MFLDKKNLRKLVSKYLMLILIISNLSVPTRVSSLSNPEVTPFINDTFFIQDTSNISSLPSRFRVLPQLKISGSAEFFPNQLPNIKNAISNNDIVIVDLRQESHGFINDIPISLYSYYETINNGLDTDETMECENDFLKSIDTDSTILIFTKEPKLEKTLTVNDVKSENKVVKDNELHYKRFAIRDGGIPSPDVIDDFIIFVNDLSENTHVHFHCHEGEGRTTTFMSLYQMMKNTQNESLESILSEQLKAGGIILTDNENRAKLLDYFYQYTVENMKDGFRTPYSKWLSDKS